MQTSNACRNCKRYYPNVSSGVCPLCGGILQTIDLTPWDTYSCESGYVGTSDSNSAVNTNYASTSTDWTQVVPEQKNTITISDHGLQPLKPDSPLHSIDNDSHINNPNNEKTMFSERLFEKASITGEIIESSKLNDNRLVLTQLFQFFVYGQPLGADVYQFIIRDELDQTHYVNAYGEISGGGAHPTLHSYVEASGKFNSRRTLLASHMRIIDGPDIRFKTPAYVVHNILKSLWIPLVLLILIIIACLLSNNFAIIGNVLLSLLFIFGVTYCLIGLLSKLMIIGKWKHRGVFCLIASSIITVLVFIYSLTRM